jgi:hypothetical protein
MTSGISEGGCLNASTFAELIVLVAPAERRRAISFVHGSIVY